ncbi:hypothetical protein B0H16DRAFT_766870 [Mycena metata]|uniref:Uncharacterized protein n=1 Tax=Mycena metata TaxID=1033252 RepID=A0AAD7DY20_9AGAR|nr:hypothetical protein B0H16DRAFT_766870 [Mycena metata]
MACSWRPARLPLRLCRLAELSRVASLRGAHRSPALRPISGGACVLGLVSRSYRTPYSIIQCALYRALSRVWHGVSSRRSLRRRSPRALLTVTVVVWRLSCIVPPAPIARPHSVVRCVLGVFVTEPSRQPLPFVRPRARAPLGRSSPASHPSCYPSLPALVCGVFPFGAHRAFLLNCTVRNVAPAMLLLPGRGSLAEPSCVASRTSSLPLFPSISLPLSPIYLITPMLTLICFFAQPSGPSSTTSSGRTSPPRTPPKRPTTPRTPPPTRPLPSASRVLRPGAFFSHFLPHRPSS